MWETLLSECSKIAANNIRNEQDADDCIQDVMLKLMNDPDKIRQMDENALRGYLKKLIKISIFEKYSMEVAKNKTAYWRYKQISMVCEKYMIQPTPQNAYLIAPLMEDEQYTISAVERILRDIRPRNVSLDCLIEL